MMNVEKLTDNVPNVTWGPLGTIGEVSPSIAQRELDRDIWNNSQHYGTRTVRDARGAAFFQALVYSLDHFHWINLHGVLVKEQSA